MDSIEQPQHEVVIPYGDNEGQKTMQGQYVLPGFNIRILEISYVVGLRLINVAGYRIV